MTPSLPCADNRHSSIGQCPALVRTIMHHPVDGGVCAVHKLDKYSTLKYLGWVSSLNPDESNDKKGLHVHWKQSVVLFKVEEIRSIPKMNHSLFSQPVWVGCVEVPHCDNMFCSAAPNAIPIWRPCLLLRGNVMGLDCPRIT